MSEGLEQATEAPEAQPEETQENLTVADQGELEQQADIPGEQEAADEAAGDEPPAAAEEEGAWRQDPDLLEYAASAGIPPEELEDYENRYVLEREIRGIDRRYRAGLQYEAPPQQAEPPAQPPQAPSGAPPAPAGLPALDPELTEEPLYKAIEARDKHWQAQFDTLSGQFNEAIDHFNRQARDVEFQQVQQVMDGLGHDDLLGKSDKLVPGSTQQRNRAKVIEAFCYLENRFRPDYSGPTKAMVQRAIHSEFWSELKKEESRKFRQKVGKQGKRVLPGQRRRSTAPETSEELPAGGVSDREVKELAQRARTEHGEAF